MARASPEIDVQRATATDPEVREYLEADPIGNAYPLSFADSEPERASLWVVRRDGVPGGHMFVYDAREFSTHWVYLGGEANLVPQLLVLLPPTRSIVTAPSDLAGAVSKLPGVTESFVQKLMLVERGQEKLVESRPAIRLTPEHAASYAKLAVPSSVQVTDAVVALNRRFLETEVVYGIFAEDGTLAAVAGTNARSPGVWIVSGVETAPGFRRRGFGTRVVSAVTRDAIREAGRAALYVDRDASEAVRLYERLGYRTERECGVIDFGTGVAR